MALTLPPQILIGIGLSLVLSALTETALAGRAPQAIHGGWTISARHAGVVIGLLALTPIFTHDIAQQREDAIDAGTAVILDSPVNAAAQARPGRRRSPTASTTRTAKCRRSARSSSRCRTTPSERAEVEQLRDELQDQLDRGATHAFSPSFGLAALLGLLALIPIGARAEGRPVSSQLRSQLLVGSARSSLSLALVGIYLAAGGASYTPEKTQDPCKPRPWREPAAACRRSPSSSRSRRSTAPPASSGSPARPLARALATDRGARTLQQALRDRRRRSSRRRSAPASCGRSTTPKKPARSARSSPARCGRPSKTSRSTRRSNWSRTPARSSATLQGFLGPAGDLLEELLP